MIFIKPRTPHRLMRDLLTAFCNLFVSDNKGLDVHLAATGHGYEEEHFGLQRNVRALGLRKRPLSAVERRAGARRVFAADSIFERKAFHARQRQIAVRTRCR